MRCTLIAASTGDPYQKFFCENCIKKWYALQSLIALTDSELVARSTDTRTRHSISSQIRLSVSFVADIVVVRFVRGCAEIIMPLNVTASAAG